MFVFFFSFSLCSLCVFLFPLFFVPFSIWFQLFCVFSFFSFFVSFHISSFVFFKISNQKQFVLKCPLGFVRFLLLTSFFLKQISQFLKMYCFEFSIVFQTCFAFKFCISSFFDTIFFSVQCCTVQAWPATVSMIELRREKEDLNCMRHREQHLDRD